MRRDLAVVGLLLIWATIQASLIYVVDRNWLAAGAWALLFLGLMCMAFGLLGQATVSFGLWLSRTLRLDRFRHVPLLALGLGKFCGILFGPIFGILLAQQFGLPVTAFRAAVVGWFAGSVVFFALGLVLGMMTAIRHSHSGPQRRKRKLAEAARDKSKE